MNLGDRVEWCGSLDTRRWTGTIQKIFSSSVMVQWDTWRLAEHRPIDLRPLGILDRIAEALREPAAVDE